jgi:hypothetical protein
MSKFSHNKKGKNLMIINLFYLNELMNHYLHTILTYLTNKAETIILAVKNFNH